MAEEQQPGPDWERVTAWMNTKNPNWKRVEPKMRALAVRKARSGRLSPRSVRLSEDLKRAKALGREAVEWSELLRRDPTAIARAPQIFKASWYYRSDFLKNFRPASPSRIPRLMPPRRMPPPRRIGMSPPPPLLPDRGPLPPWKEVYEKMCEDPEEVNEGFKMILSATLEEMRDRLPPDSNPRRWFEGILNNM